MQWLEVVMWASTGRGMSANVRWMVSRVLGAASSSASSSHASRSAERQSSSRYQPYARTQTTAATTSVPRVQNRSYHGMESGWADATVVYTDGACSNNGQRGARAGYGVFWGPGHPDNCFGPVDGAPTNNRGELQAVAVALTQAVGKGFDKIIVRTDSMLLINSLDSWITGWKRNGWKTSSGQAVKNVELLQDIDDKRRMINVKFEHVRGHAGIEGNERADELARMGARA